MLKTKKGFTIVELVIVIAIIAILAAVLIPTFSSVIDKANKTAAQTKANTALTVSRTQLLIGKQVGEALIVVDEKYCFVYGDNKMVIAEENNGMYDKDTTDIKNFIADFNLADEACITFAPSEVTESLKIANFELKGNVEETNKDIPKGVYVFLKTK